VVLELEKLGIMSRVKVWMMDNNKIKNFLREPLVHFFLLGGLIFALNGLFGRSDYIPENNEILVTAKRINSLVDQYAMQMGRPASQEEIKGFIEKHIREEVLSREAKLLGLDNDDIVIRRRLVQKMEFMSGDFTGTLDPTTEELEAFFSENIEDYRQAARMTFFQVYINSQDLSESELESKVEIIRQELQGIKQSPELSFSYGDRTMLSHQISDASSERIFQLYGNKGLAEAIEKAPEGEWFGPLQSTYGHHLIYVSDRSEASLPEFSELASQVEQDFLEYQKILAKEEIFRQMKARYIVTMDEELELLYNE
jgi:hypothetical protein